MQFSLKHCSFPAAASARARATINIAAQRIRTRKCRREAKSTAARLDALRHRARCVASSTIERNTYLICLCVCSVFGCVCIDLERAPSLYCFRHFRAHDSFGGKQTNERTGSVIVICRHELRIGSPLIRNLLRDFAIFSRPSVIGIARLSSFATSSSIMSPCNLINDELKEL